MFSSSHSKTLTTHSILPLTCVLVGFGFSSANAVWSASGTVRNTTGSTISGVTITVKDSSNALKTSTDGNGNFTIGTATGILGRNSPSDFSIHQENGELVVNYPAASGVIQLSLVDISGATLWRSHALLDNGVARAPFSINSYHGASYSVVTNVRDSCSHGGQ